jgi:hypothetical protein
MSKLEVGRTSFSVNPYEMNEMLYAMRLIYRFYEDLSLYIYYDTDDKTSKLDIYNNNTDTVENSIDLDIDDEQYVYEINMNFTIRKDVNEKYYMYVVYQFGRHNENIRVKSFEISDDFMSITELNSSTIFTTSKYNTVKKLKIVNDRIIITVYDGERNNYEFYIYEINTTNLYQFEYHNTGSSMDPSYLSDGSKCDARLFTFRKSNILLLLNREHGYFYDLDTLQFLYTKTIDEIIPNINIPDIEYLEHSYSGPDKLLTYDENDIYCVYIENDFGDSINIALAEEDGEIKPFLRFSENDFSAVAADFVNKYNYTIENATFSVNNIYFDRYNIHDGRIQIPVLLYSMYNDNGTEVNVFFEFFIVLDLLADHADPIVVFDILDLIVSEHQDIIDEINSLSSSSTNIQSYVLYCYVTESYYNNNIMKAFILINKYVTIDKNEIEYTYNWVSKSEYIENAQNNCDPFVILHNVKKGWGVNQPINMVELNPDYPIDMSSCGNIKSVKKVLKENICTNMIQ